MKLNLSMKSQVLFLAFLTCFIVNKTSLAGAGRDGCKQIDKSNVADSLDLHEARMKALCDENGNLQRGEDRKNGLFAKYKIKLQGCKDLGEGNKSLLGIFSWNTLVREENLYTKRLDASCRAFKESLASADKSCGEHKTASEKVKAKTKEMAKLKDRMSSRYFAQQEEILSMSEVDFKELTKGFLDAQKPINKLYGELKSQVAPNKPQPNDLVLKGHVDKMQAEIKKAYASLEKKIAEKKIPAEKSKALVECKEAAQFLKEVHASADKNVSAPLKRLQNELLQYSDSSGLQASDFSKKKAQVSAARRKADNSRLPSSFGTGVTPGWEGIPSAN